MRLKRSKSWFIRSWMIPNTLEFMKINLILIYHFDITYPCAYSHHTLNFICSLFEFALNGLEFKFDSISIRIKSYLKMYTILSFGCLCMCMIEWITFFLQIKLNNYDFIHGMWCIDFNRKMARHNEILSHLKYLYILLYFFSQ